MTLAAYYINGDTVPGERFYQVACDPKRSVVVEACAGAGKTWMLVSRILRALLDGIEPSQILAITFTRKAAGEMRERLHQWLREFAQASDAQRQIELQIRGLTQEQAAQASPRLADLYRHWLEDGRNVEIHTIHGWFSRLVRAAPLDALAEMGLPPELNVVEDTSELWPELWGRFLRRLDRASQPGEAESFRLLVREVGRFNAEAWLQQALANRLEITLADQAGDLDISVASAPDWSAQGDGQWADFSEPLDALLSEPIRDKLWALARLLAASKGAMAKTAGAGIERSLRLDTPLAQFEGVRKALLTGDDLPRKKLGDVADLHWAQQWLMDLCQAHEQAQAFALHQHMCTLSRALFDEYARLKSLLGKLDMVDLELAASHLLGDSSVAGWIQERLDTQVHQLLMDEFQDTSPLQWQTLKSWLGGYAGAGGGASGQKGLRVFLVGDPKQSIYRFRRADPRVFEAAKGFVIDGLGGDLLACDHTRRNAPGVIDLLNHVMGAAVAEGAYQGFRPHTTTSDQTARIAVLPDVPREAAGSGKGDDRPSDLWRDTLIEPRETPEASLKQVEAEHVACAIAELVRTHGVAPEEIFVLSRKRATLSWVAQALLDHGLPHVAPEDTRLTDTPPVRDMLALVEALVSPQHNLALAHALRSPVFGWSDEQLMQLAAQARVGGCWWDALMSWSDANVAVRETAQRLSHWRELARLAPPHDLLEAILVQGQVRQRLVAAVPPSQRDQALSHLDALLAHTLDMDGGRDATPYRWVRALKRVPLTLPGRAHSGAVQLLTIHGAKGLEARVVFIVDADAEDGKSGNYTVMVDWPESATRPVRCAFIRSESHPPPSLRAAMEHERLEQRREELNALYVALTRAREQLVFSRTEPRAANRHGSWWHRLREVITEDGDHLWAPHDPGERQNAPQSDSAVVRLPVLPSIGGPLAEPAPKGVEPGDDDAAALGQVVHKALEWLTVLPVDQREARVTQAVLAAGRAIAAPPGVAERAQALVHRILCSEELAPWLDPQALAWSGNEVSLVHRGRTLRLDRLVARDAGAGKEWWVLDYKLQHRPQDLSEYQAQMRQYVEAVSALQPGEVVRAAFITGEGRLIELAW